MRAWRKDLSDSDGSRSPSPKRNRRSRSPSQDSEGDEKKSTKPRPPVKKDLPIDSVKEDIIKLVKDNQLCIITGDTGSGKSTQLAKILYENGLSEKTNGIVVTQPRRIGAVSLAVRVAEEMECDVGDLVGYTIRFEDNTSEHTKIRYVTDGILLREVMEHKDLEPYSVVILDEDEIETACKLLGERLDSLHEDGVDMPDVVILPM
eukprot:jgi/Bigna1/143135/aug1.76_g17843